MAGCQRGGGSPPPSKLCPVWNSKRPILFSDGVSWVTSKDLASLSFPLDWCGVHGSGWEKSLRSGVWPGNLAPRYSLIRPSCALGWPSLIISFIDHWGLLVSNDLGFHFLFSLFLQSLPEISAYRLCCCSSGLEIKNRSNFVLENRGC